VFPQVVPVVSIDVVNLSSEIKVISVVYAQPVVSSTNIEYVPEAKFE